MIWFALFAVAVAILLVVVAMQPANFRVSRAAVLAAPTPAVFAQVNDFHKWLNWSPWEGIDPDLRRSYEGAPSGVGAAYSWAGNNKVGSGRMTILESNPNELIVLRLEFLKPFKATNRTEFSFSAQGGKTSVSWTMTGTNDFMAKGFHMMMNIDRMIGGEFEKGLAKLEKAAQSAA